MGRTTIEELRNRRVNAMTSAERAEFDEALTTARLAIDVGEKVREAREAAGLSQRELAVHECPPAKQRWLASRPAAPAPHSRPCKRPLPRWASNSTSTSLPAH